ncbi:MAG: preprotein translocase subunit SecE [Eubacteriales bacterium]
MSLKDVAMLGNQVKKGSNTKQDQPKPGFLKKLATGSKNLSKGSGAKPDRKQTAPKKEKVNYIEQLKTYFKGVYSELKKVHWSSRREVIIYTGVVLVAVIIVGVLIWAFDSFLSRLLQLILE